MVVLRQNVIVRFLELKDAPNNENKKRRHQQHENTTPFLIPYNIFYMDSFEAFVKYYYLCKVKLGIKFILI